MQGSEGQAHRAPPSHCLPCKKEQLEGRGVKKYHAAEAEAAEGQGGRAAGQGGQSRTVGGPTRAVHPSSPAAHVPCTPQAPQASGAKRCPPRASILADRDRAQHPHSAGPTVRTTGLEDDAPKGTGGPRAAAWGGVCLLLSLCGDPVQ